MKKIQKDFKKCQNSIWKILLADEGFSQKIQSLGSERYKKNDSPKKLKKIKSKPEKRRKNLKIRFKEWVKGLG